MKYIIETSRGEKTQLARTTRIHSAKSSRCPARTWTESSCSEDLEFLGRLRGRWDSCLDAPASPAARAKPARGAVLPCAAAPLPSLCPSPLSLLLSLSCASWIRRQQAGSRRPEVGPAAGEAPWRAGGGGRLVGALPIPLRFPGGRAEESRRRARPAA